MNSTSSAPDGGPGAEASSSGEFTRANLFGVYLTLAFCILTQQQGSLLMEAPPVQQHFILSRLALLALRLWRLNPIACAAEAWIIFAVLGKQAVLHWISSTSPASGQEAAPMRLRLERLLDRIHVVAVALLIMRAHQVDQGGRPIWSRILEQSRHHPLDPSALPLFSNSRCPQLQTESTRNLPPGKPRGPAPPDPEPDDELLLHPGALSGNSGWIGAVTILSIVTTTIKLAAVTLPWQLRLALLFMSASWLSVALLMLLGDLRKSESLDKEAVAREITRLFNQFPWARQGSSRLDAPHPPLASVLWREGSPGPLVAPVLVYLCYAGTFGSPMWVCETPASSRSDGSVIRHACTEGIIFTPAGILVFLPRYLIYYYGFPSLA